MYNKEVLSDNLIIYQSDELYKFTCDAVLLSKFVTIKAGGTALELGTGSGVITLLLSERYQSAKFYAVEIQKELFDMAKKSVEDNNLTDRITLINGRLQDVHKTLNKKVDILFCNPPYRELEKGELSGTRSEQIAKFEVEATLKDIVESGKKNLKNGGKFFIINRIDRLSELVNLLKENAFSPSKLQFIQAKKDSNAHLFMCEAIYLGNAELTVLPPIILEK